MPHADVTEAIARGERVLGHFPADKRELYSIVWELHAWGVNLDLSARTLRRPARAVSALLAELQAAVAQQIGGTLVSIGYEGRDLKEVISTLLEHDVTTVVDVRLNAISRKRGFSKRALSDALSAAGISYFHERELGNPKENRAPFHSGDLASGRSRFFELLEEAHASLDRVIQMLSEARVALLCFERDHERCHRWCITERVSRHNPGMPVLHL
jgi:hypothetical protein